MNIGGPAAHVLSVARILGDRFDIGLAAGVPAESEGEVTDRAFPVARIPLRRELNVPADARAFAHVRRLLQITGPDVLHTHMAKAGAIGRAAARTVSPSPITVHTYHGHVLEGYFSRPKQHAFIQTERALARTTDLLVAVSAEVRDDLLDLGIGRADQYTIVPVGIDVQRFQVPRAAGALRRHLGISPDAFLVGVLARLTDIKDHATLLHALRDVPDTHLAVLGDGELRAPLQRLTARLGMAGRVHFVGWWRDVPAALADIDVVALTSRNEGTPLALMEAAAAGVPVVATAVGGVPGMVEDERTGFLVPVGRPDLVAEAVEALRTNDSRRRRMGRRARDLARARFGAPAAAEQLGVAYRRLLERRHRQ